MLRPSSLLALLAVRHRSAASEDAGTANGGGIFQSTNSGASWSPRRVVTERPSPTRPQNEPPKWRAETFLRLWRGGGSMVAVSGSAASRDAPPHAGISTGSPHGPTRRRLGSGQGRIRKLSGVFSRRHARRTGSCRHGDYLRRTFWHPQDAVPNTCSVHGLGSSLSVISRLRTRSL
jgi:hypothetical protein